MKLKLSFITMLLYSFTLFGQSSIDNDGWTILDQQQCSKVLYVSDTDGDDTTGEIYNTPFIGIGDDLQNPDESIKPFKTIAAATNQTTGGDTWILVKRGDTIRESIAPKQGLSLNKPFVYASYGRSNNPPLFLTGDNSAINICCRSFKHFAVIGLSFYAHKRNPDDPEYEDATSVRGIRIYAGGDYYVKNILIEGCCFNFYENNSINSEKGTISNIRLRRNLILNNYSTHSHSQGFYTAYIDDLLLEENIFDHNGWYKQSYTGYNDKEEGQATIFNHNTYFTNASNTTFIGNSFYRPSSIGTKWTAENGEASSESLIVENNFYHDCELAISMGGNNTTAPHRFKNVQIKGNVINSLGLSQQTDRTLGWGIEINDWDNGKCENNFLVHQNSDAVTNTRGIIIRGENRDVTIEHNTLHGLKHSNTIELIDPKFTNTTLSHNTINISETSNNHYISSNEPWATGITLDSNRYAGIDRVNHPFYMEQTSKTLAQWTQETQETNQLKDQTDYIDPTRSLERYIKEELGLSNLEEFYTNLHQQSILNWQEAYTAKAINEWIKAGFEIKAGNVAVTGITFDIHQEIVTSYVGEAFTLRPFIQPQNATNRQIEWFSENSAIAEVDNNGLVTLKQEGEVEITATTFDGSFSAVSTITVNPPSEEVCHRNFIYKTVNGSDKQLRAYFPESWAKTDKRPVAVFFHGGSWVSGSYHQMFTWAEYLASQGIVAISAEYTFGTVESCVLDTRSAMRWVKTHADTLGIDTNMVLAGGSSAGAHLAFSTYTADGLDDPNDDLSISPKPNLLALIDPALVIKNNEKEAISQKYGALVASKTNPLTDVSLDHTAPPTIFFSGTNDYRAEETHQTTQKLYDLNVDTEFWLGKDGAHGFGDKAENIERIKYRLHQFLYKHDFLTLTAAQDQSSPALFKHNFAGTTSALICPVAILNPVSEQNGMEAINLLDNSDFESGLTSLNSKHQSTTNSMWQSASGVTAQEIVFDLGKKTNLDHIHVWNWNSGTPSHKIGARLIEISVSNDANLASAQFQVVDTFKVYRGGQYSQNYYLGAQNNRLVKVNIIAVENEAFHRLGLAEVRFSNSGISLSKKPTKESRTFEIFPNPGNGQVQFSAPVTGNLKVYQSSQLIHDFNLVNQQKVNLSHLSQGIYLLSFFNEADDRVERKVYIKIN